MNSTETIKKIMESDDFVLEEVNKLRVLYALKKEIRYDHERVHESHTESVAEHIYALHCLIDYFLPLEDPEGKWDKLKIHEMAQYHDIDEIETGDKVAYKKSTADYELEKQAAEVVIEKLPELLKEKIKKNLNEYNAQTTKEARFVKAVDKIEPVFHMFCKDGKNWLNETKISREVHRKIKYPHIKEFPTIVRVEEVMANIFVKEGYYVS